jgi:hypothetical protein
VAEPSLGGSSVTAGDGEPTAAVNMRGPIEFSEAIE